MDADLYIDDSYADLPPDVARLAQIMSDTSEECWCAGWMQGTEFRLWEAITDPADHHHWGQDVINEETRTELRRLSEVTGGWFDGDHFIPMDEWLRMYEAKPGPHRRAKV